MAENASIVADFARYEAKSCTCARSIWRKLANSCPEKAWSCIPTICCAQNLEYSDLIEKRALFLNRSKGVRYFVTDEYIRFVSRWLRDSKVTTYSAFNRIFSSQNYSAWQGFDFELIAFDLLLARGDRTITVCEAKSCDQEHEPTERDVAQFRVRKAAIHALLKRKRRPEQYVNYCFITRSGVKRNRYSMGSTRWSWTCPSNSSTQDERRVGRGVRERLAARRRKSRCTSARAASRTRGDRVTTQSPG